MKTAGPRPRRRYSRKGRSEDLQDRLVGLGRERQRGGGQLLARLQGKEVGALLVGVGDHEVVRTGLQRADEVVGEVLARLHRGQVRTEGRSLAAQGIEGRVQGIQGIIDIVVVLEPGAADVGEAKAGRVEVGALDGQRGGAGLVERHLEVVAAEQVDAVVGRVAGELVDLRQQGVVLILKIGAGGVGNPWPEAKRRLRDEEIVGVGVS